MKVGFIGLGLIGGSLARAFKRHGHTIFADDRSQLSLDLARSSQVLDEVGPYRQWVDRTDAVVVAVPVAVEPAILQDLANCLPSDSVLIETSSVKAPVASLLETFRPDVGVLALHPMAGSERAGFEHSLPELFRGWPMLVVHLGSRPVPEAWVSHILEATQAHRVDVDVARHDRWLALVSHLPYVVSAALLVTAGESAQGQDPRYEASWLDVAGSGFRDTSRVGASPPVMWQDILGANQTAMVDVLEDYLGVLQGWLEDLKEGRALGNLEAARQVRNGWEERHGAS